MADEEEVLQWKENWCKDFPSNGHGTVVFNIERATPFSMQIRPKQSAVRQQWLSLEVYKDAVYLKQCSAGGTMKMVTEGHSFDCAIGVEPGKLMSYWISYDCHNMTVKYGKGYRMTDTVLLEYDFLEALTPEEQLEERTKQDGLFNHKVPRIIQQLDSLEYKEMVALYSEKVALQEGAIGEERFISKQSLTDSGIPVDANMADHKETIAKSVVDVERKVEFYSQPVISNWPPLILDSLKTTLFDLDSGNYMLSASLPPTCKELYDNVAQDGVCLDGLLDPQEKYKLSDAIRHSLTNEDGILYKKLKEKTSLKESTSEGYLRVTLGDSYGNSPGIPYVLEIWPSNYGSPVHSHGDSYAVIKVLHGGLTIFIYNKGIDNYKERSICQFDVKKGDITWISPNWYQTHRLWNGTGDFCATIQCYNYSDKDDVRCPHFHYISGSGLEGDFLPDSDFTFMKMRTSVMEEYEMFMNQHII